MQTIERLRGVLVVTREEGARLGTVSGIYVDRGKRAVSAMSFSPTSAGEPESFVVADDIQSLGRDVMFVSSEAAAKPIPEGSQPPGCNLKDLQGFWVTTLNGAHLGTLIDLDFTSKDWTISELKLADGKHVAVDPKEITIGRDEVLVPAEYAERVQQNPDARAGLLGRAFGADNVEEIAQAIRRVLKRSTLVSG